MPSITLEILSPLHIGDGQSYNAFSFLVRGGNLYFIDSSALKETLNQTQMERLLDWMETQSNPDLEIFLTSCLRDITLKNKVITKAKYNIPLEGRKPLKVFSFIKSNNKVYIPGTEIKGAFRSALLYKLAMDDFFSNEILKRLKNFRLKDALAKKKRRVDEEIQNLLLRPFASDAKYDLLRLLQISDCEFKSPSEVLQAAPLLIVGLRRRINEALNYHEVIKQKQTFQFDLQIMNDKFKPDFLKKFRFHQRQTKLVENELSLFHCAYEFYDQVLEEEIYYYSKLGGYNKALTELQKIKRQNTPESPVLRLGKHQGFLSLTLAIMIKRKDPKLYHDAFVHATKGTSYSLAFPKTRKLIKIDGEELPLGWVKLEK